MTAIALSLLIFACNQGTDSQEVRGILLDVQAKDLVQAEAVTLRTDDGKVLVFRVSPEVSRDPQHANTASHLRQHMTVGDRVVVRYRPDAEGLLAIQIADEASLR